MKIDWKKGLITSNSGRIIATFEITDKSVSTNLNNRLIEELKEILSYIEPEERKQMDIDIITKIEDLIQEAKSKGIPFNTIRVSTEIMKVIEKNFLDLQSPVEKTVSIIIRKFNSYEVIEDKKLHLGSILLEMK